MVSWDIQLVLFIEELHERTPAAPLQVAPRLTLTWADEWLDNNKPPQDVVNTVVLWLRQLEKRHQLLPNCGNLGKFFSGFSCPAPVKETRVNGPAL